MSIYKLVICQTMPITNQKSFPCHKSTNQADGFCLFFFRTFLLSKNFHQDTHGNIHEVNVLFCGDLESDRFFHGKTKGKIYSLKGTNPRNTVILSENEQGVSFITSETHSLFRFHETMVSFGEPGSLGQG